MKQIVISGYYGFDNIGDDAMIETFSKYFKGKGIDSIIMSKNPLNTSKKYDISAINRSNIFNIFSAISKSDALISGGGTLLQDVTKVISIWYYLVIIWIAIILKKPVYILFQGIGPINNKFNIWLTKKTLEKVKVIYLRDKKAYDEMQRLGFDTSNVKISSDLVYALQYSDKTESETLLKQQIKNYSSDKKYIGVSLRPWNNISNEEKFAEILDRISSECNSEIVFFPFHKLQDINYSKIIQSKMKNKSYIIQGDYLPSQVAGMMSIMKLNIGVRLHSLIFATITRVPTIGISYDPKVDGFLKEIGMESVCDYNNINEEKIINRTKEILNSNLYNYSIFDKINDNKKDVIKILDSVIGEIYGKN